MQRKSKRVRVRRGKWKDRVHLLPGEGMGERFTDLWHTHRWSTQREPLCPWKIAAWPLFQLSLPLCNCHGWGLNTYTHTHTRTRTYTSSGFILQTREVKGQTHLREEAREGEMESSHMKEYKSRTASSVLCVCSCSNISMCVCVKFFYLPRCRERESEGERKRERKPEALINHKLSLQWRNVSWKSCPWFNSLQSGKEKPVRCE